MAGLPYICDLVLSWQCRAILASAYSGLAVLFWPHFAITSLSCFWCVPILATLSCFGNIGGRGARSRPAPAPRPPAPWTDQSDEQALEEAIQLSLALEASKRQFEQDEKVRKLYEVRPEENPRQM
jgi:hypothetical protein